QEFRDAFALGCRRLYHEGQINILALDLGMAPHMPPQTGMLREGTGLRRGDDGETVSGRAVTDEAANVSRLLVNSFAGARLGLDPIDELGEPPVRPTLRRRGARFPCKYLIHRNLLPHQVPKAPDRLNPDPQRGHHFKEGRRGESRGRFTIREKYASL